ncbi:MAG TPA: Rne/Rng family ribonuclease [Phycisphaerales bacterium]|nr:Rne/Rng family ribonuclease [Phycisphaerales bacterium]
MAKREMVVNYVPGEECRVAVTENGKLEEYHAERADAVSHVGNIYLGKVVNVEPAIQAAFVDFGLEQSGFLHVSDLHPRYFPGEDSETTEMVGKKTPRRERPPIQHCLKRGQEIAVQVLKEGVGTKGPTVTGYLSIPGRFLVMMPLMDRVGVSRKVEDEETRRQMREILDQLDLPDGFGFILRTAGMERTKAELKRDLAYLQRLWKDMERRWKKGSAPRLLYSEQDLLVRSLRDMLSGDIDRIVIDNENALRRAARFLKIVAPRSAANLVHYTAGTPIFHALGIEQQIRTIHSREVPLPSGGRLVIDETEALVAIDVNSGKSRVARDAETNAYETNLEAIEEIGRQLRLRDLGGIVINDLIDMRAARHRKDVENRFKDMLKDDRARSTIAPISPFGILEMTRQRMRGSHESIHFSECPTCRGRGLVQKSDSIAADALRELATLLQYPRVARVEMVVSPRVAGELLSTKRRSLNRLERSSGKHVDVRISEAIALDRVTFYGYDERGADIDVGKLPSPRVQPDQLRPWSEAPGGVDDWSVDAAREARESAAAEPAEPEPEAEAEADLLIPGEEPVPGEATEPSGAPGGKKKRRRRRGRGRGEGREDQEQLPPAEAGVCAPGDPEAAERCATAIEAVEDAALEEATGERGGSRHGGAGGGDGVLLRRGDHAGMPEATDGEGGARRGRRRRRRGRGRGQDGPIGTGAEASSAGGREDEDRDRPEPSGGPPGGPRTARLGDHGEEDEQTAVARPPHSDEAEAPAETGEPVETGSANGEADEGQRRGRRRRRRGRGRGGRAAEDAATGAAASPDGAHEAPRGRQQPATAAPQPAPESSERDGPDQQGEDGAPRRGRRKRGGRGRGGREQAAGPSSGAASERGRAQPAPRAAPASGGPSGGGASSAGASGAAASRPATPRTLYAFRRKLAPSEISKVKAKRE